MLLEELFAFAKVASLLRNSCFMLIHVTLITLIATYLIKAMLSRNFIILVFLYSKAT